MFVKLPHQQITKPAFLESDVGYHAFGISVYNAGTFQNSPETFNEPYEWYTRPVAVTVRILILQI